MAKILTQRRRVAEVVSTTSGPILTQRRRDAETGRARAPREPWPRVKLGDVCEVTAGSPAPQEKKLFEKGTHPFIRTSDVGVVHVGHINSSRDKLNDEGIQKLRLFPKGSVLFPKSGASTFLNHRVLLDVDAYVVSHLAVIIPSEKVAPEYLLCHLATVNARDLMQDVNYPALRTTEISNIEIPLPPLSVQREIVARLERELGSVEKMTKAFEELERAAEGEFKAELKETFEEIGGGNDLTQRRRGAEVRRVTLGDVCEIDGKLVDDYSRFADYPHIGIDSIERGTGRLVGYRTVSEDKVRSGKYHFTKQHIIYSKIRPNLNKVATPEFEGLCSADSYPILPNPNCDRYWLAYLLRGPEFLGYAIPISNNRAGMPKINREELLAFEFSLPPLSVQRKIVARLDAARLRKERLVAAAKRGREVAALWRKAILKEAFE